MFSIWVYLEAGSAILLKHRKCFCSRIYVCNSAHADHYRYNRLIETFQELVNCHLLGCRIGLAKTVNVSEWTGSCALSGVRNIVLIEYGCLNHPFRFVGMFSVIVVVENSSIRKGREVRLLACFERERDFSERPRRKRFCDAVNVSISLCVSLFPLSRLCTWL